MALSRREFLRRVGLAAGALPAMGIAPGCGLDDGEGDGELRSLPEYVWEGPPGPDDLFQHGVASGDPLQDAVILWTRVTPPEFGAPAEVYWEIARDADFAERVGAGWFITHPRRDYTVKVDAGGLEPGRTYYYRFWHMGRTSPVGRTRTAPEGGVARLRFGVTSCSNYSGGYFHVYRRLAERHDLDAVLHLGDYIYEYGGGERLFPTADGGMVNRGPQPPVEIVTLKDYRVRYAQYRTDPDLQEAHRQHPFIVVWDDHETANNAWRDGAENHDPGEGDWALRKWAAREAYFEWMPIREADGGQLWRAFSYGDLLDLVMLDTRIWGRDKQVQTQALAADEERSLLGEDQEQWLAEQMRSSTATWRMIGQQVMIGHLLVNGRPFNFDQWDGYEASRARFYEVLEEEGLDNLVVVTGDIHTSWANDLCVDPLDPERYDPETGEGAIGVEFVTPAVTSSGLGELPSVFLDRLAEFNPHNKFFELSKRGYVIVDVTPERVQGAWFHLDRIDQPTFEESFVVAFHTDSGQNHLVADDAPADPPEDYPAPAPQEPS